MIARIRKRPRVHSGSFRTLFWLIRREAVLRVLRPDAVETPHCFVRQWLAMASTPLVLRLAHSFIRKQPTKGVFP